MDALREALTVMRAIASEEHDDVHQALVYELGLGQLERSDPPLEHVWCEGAGWCSPPPSSLPVSNLYHSQDNRSAT